MKRHPPYAFKRLFRGDEQVAATPTFVVLRATKESRAVAGIRGQARDIPMVVDG